MENKKTKPELFYKYYPSLEGKNEFYTERLFVHHEIHASSPLEFNDPFDCKAYTAYFKRLEKEDKELDARLTTETEKIKREHNKDRKPISMEDKLKDWLANIFRIVCITTKKDSVLMWSHYATKHRGFCLEFNNLANHYRINALKVNYPKDNRIPTISFDETLEDDEIKKIFLTKSYDWKYEEECRIFFKSKAFKDKASIVYLPKSVLTGVIFGLDMPKKDETLIREWVKEGNFSPAFYKAERKENEIGLNIQPVS